MNQKPSVHAYWKARKETHQECATRTLHFLEALSKEPGLTQWFIGGRTRKESNQPQELSIEAIGKRMKPIWKRCRGTPTPDLTDELGFSFGVWNGDDEAGASILLHCGGYDSQQKNVVSLDLSEQEFPGNEASRERFKRLLDIFVTTWDPDFAIVTTSERKDLAFSGPDWRNEEGLWEKYITKSGWLLYRRGQALFIDTTFSDSSVHV